MTPKNIVTLNDFGSVNGGVSQVCISSAIGLKKLGLNVHYFCAVDPIDERLAESDVHVTCLGAQSILDNPSRLHAARTGIWNGQAASALEELLKTLSPSETVVHIHGWPKALSASVFSTVRKLSFPSVFTLHDYFAVCPNGGFYNYQESRICTKPAMSLDCICTNCDVRSYPQKLWRVARQFAARRLAGLPRDIPHVIYISKLSKQVLQPYFQENTKWFYCRNPLSLNRAPRVEAERNQDYLFIGRLSSEKGPELFAEAVSRAGVVGKMVGDGSMLKELQQQYPQIQYMGWQNADGIRSALASARALVFPSKWYETLGLSVLEAKSAGVPVIVADNTAACELVRPDATGFIFEGANVDSIVDCVNRMGRDETVRSLSETAYDTFWQDPPTLERHCEDLLKIYSEILGGGKSCEDSSFEH